MELVISRRNHPNENYFHIMAPNIEEKLQTLRLDSEYCITLVALSRYKKEPYYMSEGNSTLHHCSESCTSTVELNVLNGFNCHCVQYYLIY